MKLRLFLAITGLLVMSGPFFAASIPRYYLLVFETEGSSNMQHILSFSNALTGQLLRSGYYQTTLEDSQHGTLTPDYLLTVRLNRMYDSWQVFSKWEDLNNKGRQWKEEIYTTDVWGREGLEYSGAQAAERLLKLAEGMKLPRYREKVDYKKYYGRSVPGQKQEFPVSLTRISIVTASMQYPYGYQYGLPFGMGFEFLEGFYAMMIPGTPLGLGLGTKIASLRGPEAYSVLPLKVFLPLYVYPDAYDFNRRDLFITAEAGVLIWYASYFDLCLEADFYGISVRAGWFYMPPYSDEKYTRAEYSRLYGSVTLHFGIYKAEMPRP